MSVRVDVLRALADVLEAHPEIETPEIDGNSWPDDPETAPTIRFQLTSHGDAAANSAAAIVRAFPGAFRKSYRESDLNLYGELAGAPVEIRTLRSDVCIAVQVGTTTKTIKDPEALKRVPEIEVTVPVYEYDCKPILAGVDS